MKKFRSGQSFVELMIAIAIGAIFMGGMAAIIGPALIESGQAGKVQVASTNAQSLLNNVRVWSEGNWNNVLSLATGSTYQYYLITSSSPYTATSGVWSIVIATNTYTTYFYLVDAYRDSVGNMTTASTGNTYDPSTKQIFSVYNWTHGVTGTISTYITRNNNAVFYQTDWSGGATGNVATLPNSQFGASTNINYSITGSISVATSSGGGSSGGTGQNIWVVDQGNNRVEEFSTGGTYESTFGSYGSGGAGHFGSPIPDVVDSNGNVWVADGAGYSQELEEFSPSGSYESEFHMGSVGDAAGIAINSGGQFFISDAYANNIEEFSATGTYMNTIGSTGSTNGKFGSNGPTGIAFDSGGNMWVADNGNNRVEKFVASGTTYVYSNKFAEPNGVVGIAFDSGGNMWMGNYNVDEYSPSGTTYAYKSTFTNGGEFSNANNLAIDSGGNIWVSDWRNNNVVELSATGTPEQTIGSYGSSTGQFNAPYGIAIY